MQQNSIILANNISVTLGTRSVLENISFSIFPGEVVSLIGLNGAGKSTLLKTILGIYPLSNGTLDLHTKKIGYVPQKLEFDRSIPLTVEEFLTIYSRKDTQEIAEKLQEVQAKKLLRKQLGALSGGELQRILIVNALLRDPELLLLDEATAGVDVTGEQLFYSLIADIHKRYGTTIVLVSHDIHLVFAQSTKVLCLDKHLCCQGSPQEVSEHPEFTKLFGSYLAPYKHVHHS
ncbi:MAG: metal ABC transporter ATP-binding protein [bacterium]